MIDIVLVICLVLAAGVLGLAIASDARRRAAARTRENPPRL
ncbi:hypothetical protein [Tsuneonella sp. HG222]